MLRLAPRLLGLVTLAVLLATAANAGGLYVNEFGTTSQANAGAGRGAWAPDASATLHNPATMTRLDDHAAATGFSVGFGRVKFDPNTGSPSGTGNGGNQAGLFPITSFSYAHKIHDRVRFGFSFFSISGSVLDPSNDWAGRFELTELQLLTISMSPTLAFRLTDWLSIGGGPIAVHGRLDWDLKLEFPPGSGTENMIRMEELDDWQASGRVGILLHPSDDLGLSVYYNTETDFDLSGDFDGPAGVTRNLNLDLPLAQFVQVSGYWQATERLALLATFNWEDWSTLDRLDVTLSGNQTTAATGFEDTYKVGFGANYRLNEDWLLQTGVMYDTSPLKNTDRTTALPIDRQIRFALGFQHQLTDWLKLGTSFVYVNLGDGKVRNPTVRGSYKDNDIFVFGLTLSFDQLPWAGKLSFAGQES
jgi:long-chain fatty acid transport protein